MSLAILLAACAGADDTSSSSSPSDARDSSSINASLVDADVMATDAATEDVAFDTYAADTADASDGSILDTLSPDRPIQVAIGYIEHACALTASSLVRCWGDNTSGELGDGTTTDRPIAGPPIPGLGHVVRIAAGNSETCALRSDHTVWCWGDGRYGLLGDGILPGPAVVGTPTKVPGIDDAEDVAVGGGFVSVIRSDRSLWTWGNGTGGTLGYPTTIPCDDPPSGGTCSATPKEVTAVGKVAQVAFGAMHTCVVRQEDDSVWCWGQNASGELGDGTTTNRWLPKPVPGLAPVATIAAGGAQTVALTKTGEVYRWGTMDPTGVPQEIPTPVKGFSGPVAGLSIGFYSDCALIVGGMLECWWVGASGSPPGAPTPLSFAATPVESASAGGFACLIGSDHALYCFGDAYYLGDGSYLSAAPTPVKIVW